MSEMPAYATEDDINEEMKSDEAIPETDENEMSDELEELSDDDIDIQTYKRANEISQQFETIKDRTISDGVVEGKVKEIDTSPANGNVVVTVDVPSSTSDETFRFSKPKVWSKRYEFVRWVRHYGYNADSFPNMLKDGCEVKVSRADNSFELVVPSTKKERITDPISNTWNWYTDTAHPLSFVSFYGIIGIIVAAFAGASGLMTIQQITPKEFIGAITIATLLIGFSTIVEGDIFKSN